MLKSIERDVGDTPGETVDPRIAVAVFRECVDNLLAKRLIPFKIIRDNPDGVRDRIHGASGTPTRTPRK